MESGSKVHKFNELMSLFCSELKRKNCLFFSLRQAGTNENTISIIYFIIGKVKKKVTALLRKVVVLAQKNKCKPGLIESIFYGPSLYKVTGMG